MAGSKTVRPTVTLFDLVVSTVLAADLCSATKGVANEVQDLGSGLQIFRVGSMARSKAVRAWTALLDFAMVGTAKLSGRIQSAGDQVENLGTSLEVFSVGSRAVMPGAFVTLLDIAVMRTMGIGSDAEDVADQVQYVGASLQVA
jgi:hypothetical protein